VENRLWSFFFLNRDQLNVKFILVRLFQESNQKLARSQDLRLEHDSQEALIVLDSFSNLAWRKFFLYWFRQRWHYRLGERTEQIFSQSCEVLVETLYLPLKWVGVNRQQQRVCLLVAKPIQLIELGEMGDDSCWRNCL
jgi:hypothetical protein